MMFIGVSLGSNSSACVISHRGIDMAISEERLLNEKNTKKFPINALKACLEYYADNDGEFEIHIGISSYEVISFRTIKYMTGLSSEAMCYGNASIWDIIGKYIEENTGINKARFHFHRVDHHTAHRLPAIYMSGFYGQREPIVAITYDGFGEGICATICDVTTGQIISKIDLRHSLALVYQFVTGALGFKEHQHEGKVTGLAAFGQPKYVEEFKNMIITFDKVEMTFKTNYSIEDYDYGAARLNHNIHDFSSFLALRNAVYSIVKALQKEGATREDISSSVQFYVESLVVDWIVSILNFNNISGMNIVLSGGFFANVKVNWAVKKWTNARNLFVLPPMGDEGTCLGAAIATMIETEGKFNVIPALMAMSKNKLYLGKVRKPFRDLIDCASIIDSSEVRPDTLHAGMFDKPYEVSQIIADFLADGKIVCVSRGDSEFGPRALGNHSILYDAGKYETNKWLNEKLNRTEFMPFAPIVMDCFAEDLFFGTAGLRKTLRYMTITLEAKKEFIDNYKAACHVDNTARPQILYEEDNPILYRAMQLYYTMTGKKALINTSFNLHNSPIILSDKVALESFLKAELDLLVLDNLYVEKVV